MSLALADLRDVSTFPPPGADGELILDLTTTQIRGARVVLEWIVRAWFTARGSLRWAPSKGVDLRARDNATFDMTELEQLRTALEAEALRVEYVNAIGVTVTRLDRALRIEADVQLVDGRAYPLAVMLADGAAVVEVGP